MWLPLGGLAAGVLLGLLVGWGGLDSLGHAAFWGLGGYAAALHELVLFRQLGQLKSAQCQVDVGRGAISKSP